MKKILLAFVILAFVSCTKKNTVDAPFDPNKQYAVKYQTSDQTVKTRVVNDTLRLDFYQNVNLLVDPYDYAHTWALDLMQDFSNSFLKDLHFDTPANTPAGSVHDWVPVNLNDVGPDNKTITNVTVDGKQYVQVNIKRLFKFFSAMGSSEAAIAKQSDLLKKTTDYVTYKAFYSYNNIYSVSNDANIKLVYQQQ